MLRVPEHAFLASRKIALEFNGLLLVERNAILDGPDRPDRSNVRPLRAQERVQVQMLGVANPPVNPGLLKWDTNAMGQALHEKI